MEKYDHQPPPLHKPTLDQLILTPTDWIPNLISLQAELIHNTFLFIFSPIIFLFNIASDTYRRSEATATTMEAVVLQAPAKITHGGAMILKKFANACVVGVQVLTVGVLLGVLAAILGVMLVKTWAEEPVVVRENLMFDYRNQNPEAVVSFGEGGGSYLMKRREVNGIPVGHTYQVRVTLLMPESNYNAQVGVFQMTAEVLTTSGDVIGRSTRPCLLHFKSLPIRLARTFFMWMPLLLGIWDETQTLNIEILMHKEDGVKRTKAIRIILSPRAGTQLVPQLYEAEIFLKSKQPWLKHFVYSWRYIFYVLTSFYMFNILLVGLICCYTGPRLFQVATMGSPDQNNEELEDADAGDVYGKRASESFKKWQQRRRKRKAIILQESKSDASSSSVSSARVSRETTSTVVEEDFGDSESVCS